MPWNISVPDAECYAITPHALADIDRSALESVVNEVAAQPVVAIDTETTGLTNWKDIPLFWSLSWGDRRICMPSETLPFFQQAFDDPRKKWLFANAKYDAHILGNVGIKFKGHLVDTAVMHALLYEEKSHRLKDMAKETLGWKWSDFQDTFGRIPAEGPGPILMKAWEESPSKLIDYASNDAYGTYHLYLKLKAELEKEYTHSLYPQHYDTLWDIFWKIEVPFTRVLFSCERHGVRVDTEYLAGLKAPMQKELDDIHREINKIVGEVINPNSPDQLRKYLVDKCGLHPRKMTKGGKKGIRQPSVDADFLEYYEDENPVAALCLRYRDLSKTLGTYVEGLNNHKDPYGRVHTKFNQDVARTGRLSSSEPNLQNIPKPDNDRFKLRGAFIPAEGCDLIVADYEQLEMRLLAAASGEPDMVALINRGWDIHMGNAAMVFGASVAEKFGRATPYEYDDFKNAKAIDKKVKAGQLPPEAITAEIAALLQARDWVKTIGFGLNYGMKENKLAKSLKITKEEALALMEQYMSRYPAVKAFFDEAVEETRQTKYAYTVLGRRRSLPEIDAPNDMDRWKAERQAGNTQIQGSAADVAKMAMVLCFEDQELENRYGCKMLLQVHDELMFECPKENIPVCKEIIKQWMEHPLPTDLSVPLNISIGAGKSWLEAK